MKNLTLLISLLAFISTNSFGQASQSEIDSINRLNKQDHQLMMNQLGIRELRSSSSNSTESNDSLYLLPDPLVFKNGSKVKTVKQWEKRKLEIKEDFDREIYGRVPADTPAVTWKVLSEKDTMNGSYPVHVKQLLGHVDNSMYPAININIELTLTTQAHSEALVPIIMELGWQGMQSQSAVPTWEQQILQKNWGYAILIPTSYPADNGAGLREGIIGLVNKGQPRKLDDWGALRAWAWGASRAMDYFETNQNVDSKRIGIAGLSRYGKAALIALAFDSRFAIGFIGSSGAGGAKILRRVVGEQVEFLAAPGEYHWFAPNFIKYAGPLTPNDLPIDAHELIAMCAPRPIFIGSGSKGLDKKRIDPKGMFIAAVHAGPVYKLLGKKNLGINEIPQIETSLISGEIAF